MSKQYHLMLNPSFYRPGPQPAADYPHLEACGALISIEGQPDILCPAEVMKRAPGQLCIECKTRRHRLMLAKRLRAKRAGRKRGGP